MIHTHTKSCHPHYHHFCIGFLLSPAFSRPQAVLSYLSAHPPPHSPLSSYTHIHPLMKDHSCCFASMGKPECFPLLSGVAALSPCVNEENCYLGKESLPCPREQGKGGGGGVLCACIFVRKFPSSFQKSFSASAGFFSQYKGSSLAKDYEQFGRYNFPAKLPSHKEMQLVW